MYAFLIRIKTFFEGPSFFRFLALVALLFAMMAGVLAYKSQAALFLLASMILDNRSKILWLSSNPAGWTDNVERR